MTLAIWLACTVFLAHFVFARIPESCQDATIGFAIVALVMVYR